MDREREREKSICHYHIEYLMVQMGHRDEKRFWEKCEAISTVYCHGENGQNGANAENIGKWNGERPHSRAREEVVVEEGHRHYGAMRKVPWCRKQIFQGQSCHWQTSTEWAPKYLVYTLSLKSLPIYCADRVVVYWSLRINSVFCVVKKAKREIL